jgi:hypothetical protein
MRWFFNDDVDLDRDNPEYRALLISGGIQLLGTMVLSPFSWKASAWWCMTGVVVNGVWAYSYAWRVGNQRYANYMKRLQRMERRRLMKLAEERIKPDGTPKEIG